MTAAAGLAAFSFVCKGSGDHDRSHTWVLYAQDWNPERLREQPRQLLRAADLPEQEIYPSNANIRLPFGLHMRTNTRGVLLLQDGRRFSLDVYDELIAGVAAVAALPRNTLPPPSADVTITSGPKPKKASAAGVLLPLDDYNARCDRTEVEQLLTGAGWSEARSKGSVGYWVRPGKHARAGHSATLGYVADTVLSVFSTSDSTLPGKNPEGIHYSSAAVYTHLYHAGDFEAAAKALYALGYGTRWEDVPPTFDADDRPHCPQCGKLLRQSKNGNSWRCLHTDGTLCYYWPGDAAHPNTQQTAQAATPTDEAGAPLLPSEIVLRGLHALGYTFALNLCSDTIEVNGKPISDIIEAEIAMRAWDTQIKPLGLIKPSYTTEAARNAYHPIKAYLNATAWDGEDHIAQLAAHITCPDPPIVYDDGHTGPLQYVYLKRWMIGAVAKVFEQAQNPMLVTVGPQDIGKSAFARWLCSGIPDRFLEDPIRTEDKDSSVRLMTHFLWEVAELDATTRRSDVSALKAFITKDTVTVRKAYGHHDIVKPAAASMIGTVNDGVGFLSDETGSRRFLVFRVAKLDWSYTKLDINQLWAQAAALYRAGEPWRLLPCEVVARNQQNQQFAVDDLLDGWLEKYFDFGASLTRAISTADIADHLARHDIRMNGGTEAQAQAIGRAMRRRNAPWRHTRSGRRYYGIVPRDTPRRSDDGDDTTLHNPSPNPSHQPTASQSPGEGCEGCEGKNPMEMEYASIDATRSIHAADPPTPPPHNGASNNTSIGKSLHTLHTLHTPQQNAANKGEGFGEGFGEDENPSHRTASADPAAGAPFAQITPKAVAFSASRARELVESGMTKADAIDVAAQELRAASRPGQVEEVDLPAGLPDVTRPSAAQLMAERHRREHEAPHG